MRCFLLSAAWTLGSQTLFEAGNELPPSQTAAGVTPEGTDPALESDPSATQVTLPEGAAPASEDDSRVRGQAEAGGAAYYVAAENILMVGHGDSTVAGPLRPPLSQHSATPAAARVTAEGTGLARESDPLAAGVTPSEAAAPASEGDGGVRDQMEPGGVSVATVHSRTAGNRETTAPGHSPPPLTQPSVTPATSGATMSMSTGAVEGGGSTRGRRGRPRGS